MGLEARVRAPPQFYKRFAAPSRLKMSLLAFVAKVVAISSSGALSPGPLTAATFASGAERGWKAGALVALGHAIVEFPLIALIAVGAVSLASLNQVLLSAAGGLTLLIFGLILLADVVKGPKQASSPLKAPPLVIGVSLSALNPWFIAWWALIGGVLAVEAYELMGILGIPLLFASHVWLDFAWLALISHAGKKGRELTGRLGYRILMALIAVAMFVFAADFLTSAATGSRLFNF